MSNRLRLLGAELSMEEAKEPYVAAKEQYRNGEITRAEYHALKQAYVEALETYQKERDS